MLYKLNQYIFVAQVTCTCFAAFNFKYSYPSGGKKALIYRRSSRGYLSVQLKKRIQQSTAIEGTLKY